MKETRCAKHRFLILMCVSFAMPPSIVAPPERAFSQGQPEMNQAMDNMIAHGNLVKKTGNLPRIVATGYPALSPKTSGLLEDAEHILKTMPNSRERQMIQVFVRRMKALGRMQLKMAENQNHHSPMNMNSDNGTPVPQILPPQPTWSGMSAVPGLNSVQTPSKTSPKLPVTSPELSKVLTDKLYSSESQVITKPAVLLNKRENDDELVRELESLRHEVTAEIPVQNSKVTIPTLGFTSPATPMLWKSSQSGANDVEEKRSKLREKLLKELADYRLLGGDVPNDIISSLSIKKNITGFTNMHNTEVSKSEDHDAKMADETMTHDLKDPLGGENRISQMNLKDRTSGKSLNLRDEYLYMKANYTPQNSRIHFHSNLPAPSEIGNHFPYMSEQSNEQPYQKDVESQQMPADYHDDHQVSDSNKQEQSHASNALIQKMHAVQKSISDGHFPLPNFKGHMRPMRYRPYRYNQQWVRENSTHDLQSEIPPYSLKSSSVHKIDTQLNDEMKRQLRDGKIVILSDSVVPLNSKTGTKAEMTKSETGEEIRDEDPKNNTAETGN